MSTTTENGTIPAPAAREPLIEAALALHIEGSQYALTVLRRRPLKLTVAKLNAGPGHTHTVEQQPDGAVTCTCPARPHRAKRGTCRHIAALVEVGLLVVPEHLVRGM